MESIVARFWWQKAHGKRGIHQCEQSKICELKENRGMSFRSFVKFNVALLEKQGWDLITNNNYLLAQVLKVKYYPHTDFLSSNLKNGASYTWKSIQATKKVIQDGLGRKVGIEDKVHAWILGSSNYKLINPDVNCNMELVIQLIDNNREWKMELITTVFDEVDASRIFRITLATDPHSNVLAWRCEAFSEFSVLTPINYYRLVIFLLVQMNYKPILGFSIDNYVIQIQQLSKKLQYGTSQKITSLLWLICFLRDWFHMQCAPDWGRNRNLGACVL